jgi:hypothetical protein
MISTERTVTPLPFESYNFWTLPVSIARKHGSRCFVLRTFRMEIQGPN